MTLLFKLSPAILALTVAVLFVVLSAPAPLYA